MKGTTKMISEARQAIKVTKLSHYGKTKLKVEAFAGKKFYPFDNEKGYDENLSNAANSFAAFYHWDQKFEYIGANLPKEINSYVFVGVPRKKKKEIKKIEVLGRRWFDRKNGNTYCASKVYINDNLVITTNWTYGYEEFYLQLANEELNKAGLIKSEKHTSTGSLVPLWRYCSENDIDFSYSAIDGTKRDLIAFSKDKPERE